MVFSFGNSSSLVFNFDFPFISSTICTAKSSLLTGCNIIWWCVIWKTFLVSSINWTTPNIINVIVRIYTVFNFDARFTIISCLNIIRNLSLNFNVVFIPRTIAPAQRHHSHNPEGQSDDFIHVCSFVGMNDIVTPIHRLDLCWCDAIIAHNRGKNVGTASQKRL